MIKLIDTLIEIGLVQIPTIDFTKLESNQFLVRETEIIIATKNNYHVTYLFDSEGNFLTIEASCHD